MRQMPPDHFHVELAAPGVEPHQAPSPPKAKLPADCAAIRYCDSTIRRSSSLQRGSLLSRKIDGPAGAPELPPMGGRSTLGFSDRG